MPYSIDDISRKTQRYWFEDGIWEIGFGSANLMIGLFYLASDKLQFTGPVLLIGQIFVFVGIFFLLGRFVKYAKEHITYPRTGFVAYQKPSPPARLRRILTTVVLSIGISAVVAFAATIRIVQNTQALVTGILMGGVLVYFGYRFRLARMYIVAALTILAGYAISLVDPNQVPATALFFSLFGLVMAACGGITLMIYLRSTQPAGPADLELEDGSPPHE